jgi:hypothetical protein
MDFGQVFLYVVLFFIGLYVVLRLIDRWYPDVIVKAICLLLVPLIVDVAVGVHNSMLSALEDAERGYTEYVYKKYCIHRTKKKFGLIPKDEPFVWNDNLEDERIANTFRFVMGDNNGKTLQTE